MIKYDIIYDVTIILRVWGVALTTRKPGRDCQHGGNENDGIAGASIIK